MPVMLPFDASEIDNWADTDDGRSKLPNLIRWLVKELGDDILRVDMPGGSSVVHRGWDGVTEAVHGNQWVPSGITAWEFSCNKEIKETADDNYEKRTCKPLGLEPSDTTFIFITPRRWNKKEEWARERREEGLWKDVLVWDANDLVSWLEESPTASERFALVIDRRFPARERRRQALREDSELNKINLGIAEIKSLLHPILPIADQESESTGSSDDSDQAHSELVNEINFARDLVKRRLTESARTELERIRSSHDEIPEHLQFRILTNLAACDLASENIDRACNMLDEAYELQPESEAGFANAAVAAQLRGNSSLAIEMAQRARELNPENSQATAVLLGQLWDTGDTEKLEGIIDSEGWIVEDAQCALTLVSIRAYQGHFGDALQLCRNFVEANSEDPSAHIALSQCLLMQFQSWDLQAGYDSNSFSKLREAEAEADRAVSLLESTQLRHQFMEALVARSGARAHLGDADGAMDDLNRVLVEVPSHPVATMNKGLLLLKQGSYVEATDLLERVDGLEEMPDLAIPLADAYLTSGQPKATVNILQGTVRLDSPSWEDIWRAELLLRAELRAEIADSVGEILDNALVHDPDNPRLLSLKAVRSNLLNDPETSESLFLSAIECADGVDRRAIQVQLGTLYERMERFREAADVLTEAVEDELYHPATIPLLMCLCNSRRYGETLDLAQRIREAYEPVPRVVIEIESAVLERIGDMPALIARLKELCANSDASSVELVRLAAAHLRSGATATALETLLQIDPPELCDEPEALLKLAELKQILGIEGFLEDAYLARRCGMDSPRVHIGYLRIFQNRSDDLPQPEIIQLGCAVLLRDEEGDNWWQILEGNEERQGTHQLKATDSPAQLLLERRVGETVIFRGEPDDLAYEIIELQSKYVRAFQESIQVFPTLFPGNMALSRIRIENDNFEKLFQIVDQRDDSIQRLDELYQNGILPFSTFCSRIGRSPVEVWRQYPRETSGPLRFARGTDEEEGRAKELLKYAKCLVLDTVALLTVHELALAEPLCERFERVVVPQQVFDEVLNLKYSVKIGSKPSGYFGRQADGNHTIVEMPDEAWGEWQKYVESVFKLTESFERIPSYGILRTEDVEDVVATLTEVEAGAIYAGDVAPTDGQILVADDLMLSDIALLMGVPTVNMQGVLLDLLSSGAIEEDDYSSFVENLVMLGYKFIRIRESDLHSRLEDSGYMTTEGTRAMLATLQGPDCTVDSAVYISVSVIAFLLENGHFQQAGLILPFVMEQICKGRDVVAQHKRHK